MSGILQILLSGFFDPDVVNVLGCSESDIVSSPGVAAVSYSFTSSGVETGISGSTTTFTNQAVTPSSHANLYEVRLVTGSGTTPTGSALDTWLGLTAAPSWGLARSVNGSVSFTGTIEIRLIGGSTTIDSAAVSLYAEVIP